MAASKGPRSQPAKSTPRPRPSSGATAASRSGATPNPSAPRQAANSRSASPRPGNPVKVTWTTPGANSLRHRIEVASRGLLVRVQRLPRWVPFAVALLLTFGGAALPGWYGAACLLVIAAFLVWLLYLAWPALGAGPRALRMLTGAVIVAYAIYRVVQR